jgi:hypothetical protein
VEGLSSFPTRDLDALSCDFDAKNDHLIYAKHGHMIGVPSLSRALAIHRIENPHILDK